MPDYSQGKVYKIVNSVNDIIYIGSTCQQLSARMGGHRSRVRTGQTQAMYCDMREIGAEKFRIVLIEDFPCSNKSQLEAREFKHMADAQFARVQLYNHMIDGRHSEASREKIRQIKLNMSDSTRMKISQAQRGKFGAQAKAFKRGSIMFSPSINAWRFEWRDSGKVKAKSWSVNKYGESAAHAFALILQDEIYPKIDDDKEFIEEIRARLQKGQNM